MADTHERTCNICSHDSFSEMARRSDGTRVLRCNRCQMGVIENIPQDLTVFYTDDYYRGEGEFGYRDYALMAEHGVAWAASLVKCLRPSGRVLDIGCADGFLLGRLGPAYEPYGVEVNETMAIEATKAGVHVISRDLFAPELAQNYQSSFDVITVIAVFEHLRDFKKGFATSLDLLKADGVLLFEVPLISDVRDNAVWFNSSLEHVYYPTESSISQLVTRELGLRLTGSEIHVRDYASTFVGVITKDETIADAAAELFNRLSRLNQTPRTPSEREARLQLRLVHAATSSPDVVSDLDLLPQSSFTGPFVQRLKQIWTTDIRKLEETTGALAAANAQNDTEVRALKQLLNKALRTNERQVDALTTSKARNDALRAEVDRLTAELSTLSRDRQLNVTQMVEAMIGVETRYRATNAELRAVLNSNSWKATLPFQKLARKYPRAALIARSALMRCWRQFRLVSWASDMIQGRQADIGLPKVGATPARTDSRSFQGASEVVDATIDPTTDLGQTTNARVWPRDRPLVSIVIPCFNYGQFVGEAVESALAQTLKDLEVIVVEGGSTRLDSRRSVATLNHTRVRVLLQDNAARVGANRNLGISQARGKYVCCLDADDQIDPTYIEKAVFLLEHYDYDVVSTALKFFGDRSDKYVVMEQPLLADMLSANHILTCAVFRRELWEKAGGFHDFADPEGHVHEDWAFWMRLAAMGARLWNISGESLFFYRSHGGASLSNSNPVPLDRQAAVIKAYNGDVLAAGAVERTNELATGERRSMEPLDNLARGHDPTTNRTVLVALPFTVIGGAERLLSAVLSHLSEKGWRVIIVTTVPVSQEHGDTSDWFRRATSEIYHLPRFLAPERWRDFVHYLFTVKSVDLLWIVGSAFFYDLIPALKTRYPYLHIIDLLFNTVGHTSNNRKYALSIDLIIVENQEVRNWLLDHGERAERIKVIESGVDIRSHRPRPKDRQVLEQLHIADGTLVVGFLGRWSEEKDPLGFIEIARRTQAEGVAFVMTGTGHMRPQVEAAIAAANFPQGRFHLVGPTLDVTPYVSSYDVLCLPSRLDGRPLAVLEALAMGVPVLASRIGALPELIGDAVNGMLFAAGDYDGFARGIDELAASRQKLGEMKVEARRFAERKLDACIMLEVYDAVFSSLLEQGVEPAAHRVNGGGLAWTNQKTVTTAEMARLE